MCILKPQKLDGGGEAINNESIREEYSMRALFVSLGLSTFIKDKNNLVFFVEDYYKI